jgi:hypothetical protein
MAEMTVAEAIKLLKEFYPWDEDSEEDMNQIAALIEQQAAEIVKKDRMLNRAVEVIADKCTFVCTANVKPQGHCKKCKLAWLEKEAQGVERDGKV